MNMHKITPEVMKHLADLVRGLVPDLDVTLIVSERGYVARSRYISSCTRNRAIELLRSQADHLEEDAGNEKGVRMLSDRIQYNVEVSVKTGMECMVGEKRSSLVDTRVMFEAPNQLEPPLKDNDGEPTAAGLSVATKVLVAGLAANIHHGHNLGLLDSAQELRSAIHMLETLFIQVSYTKSDYWEDDK